ncbi:hypothetical protein M422DRAFT_275268 [Sphaerobolus stellatus SS14]|uniref:Unplaced genomic scaffold SPHSTscaffold_465, whole genome shotgun sequence n=1 Tax=Sphaerobolus stellatus (strain SS14) TaxID=990650 RepID=A0A0C9UFR6_SPHS4|nr:hypothetical protein M422DRAFT_275268 [Sphaerobolus stellatus SS14]
MSFSPERSVSPIPITFTKSVNDRFSENSPSEERRSESPWPHSPPISVSFNSTRKRKGTPSPEQQRLKIVRISTPEPLNRRRSSRGTSRGEPSDEDTRIPKPKGEVGHPGTHGYSLFSTLKWEKVIYDSVQKLVQKLADAKLDVTQGISKQNDDHILDLSKKVADKYPLLNRYVDY